MFENVINFFKGLGKTKGENKSKGVAKERLHLVLMQDRANISADFLALMKQEIIEVIKKYIDVDENAIDVRLTNKENGDGTTGAPVLYANIPIVSVKEEAKEEARKVQKENQANSNLQVGHSQKQQNNEENLSNSELEEEIKTENEDKSKNNLEEVEKINEVNESDTAQEVIEKAEEIVEEVKVEAEAEKLNYDNN